MVIEIREHAREFESRGFGCDFYFEASGVNWLAINCQPLGPFSHTSMLRYCPLASLPLYWPLIVTRLVTTAGSRYVRTFTSAPRATDSSDVAPDLIFLRGWGFCSTSAV